MMDKLFIGIFIVGVFALSALVYDMHYESAREIQESHTVQGCFERKAKECIAAPSFEKTHACIDAVKEFCQLRYGDTAKSE